MAEQTASAEDTGKKKRQAHKPFTVDDINEEVCTEPLFHKCPGTSVLEVVSYFLPKHTLTNLALDTKIYYKEENKNKFFQVKKQHKAVTQITLKDAAGMNFERARKAAQVIALLALNGMPKQEIEKIKQVHIMNSRPKSIGCVMRAEFNPAD